METSFVCATWKGTAIVLIALLSGCASTPQYRYFTIDMQPRAALEPPVRISDIRISINQALQRPEILARTSPTQVEYFALDRWASGLEEQIAEKINTEFASAPPDRPAVEMTGTLLAFEQVDTPSGPEVLVKLDARFHELRTSNVTDGLHFRKLYLVTRPASGPGAAAAVEALSRATEAIAAQMAADLAAVVAARGKN